MALAKAPDALSARDYAGAFREYAPKLYEFLEAEAQKAGRKIGVVLVKSEFDSDGTNVTLGVLIDGQWHGQLMLQWGEDWTLPGRLYEATYTFADGRHLVWKIAKGEPKSMGNAPEFIRADDNLQIPFP